MRRARAVVWTVMSILWTACSSGSGPETRTVIILEADAELTRVATRLYVQIESEGTQLLWQEVSGELWPQHIRVEPPEGDASRRFELLAEAYDQDEVLVASHRLRAGFVAGQTRYVRVAMVKCATPSEGSIEPSALGRSESLASAVSSACAPKAGSGGAGGSGGAAGRATSAGSGDTAGATAGRVEGGGGAPAPAACGDGRLTRGELCDTGIADDQLGACPVTCPARDRCTPGQLVGSGCQAECRYRTIREPIRGDGCCPQGANANTDSDCMPTCGNGQREGDETCDPPSECTVAKLCSSQGPCTVATFHTEAGPCSVTCEVKPLQVCVSGDTCCPSTCTHAQDADCPQLCGDGSVDSAGGETCEPTSPTQPCPETCADTDPCTEDLMIGSAEACNVMCSHGAVRGAKNADGCCPEGANANNDDDCEAKCGNGMVESGELCDGNCPTGPASCDDGDVCTQDRFSGSSCQRQCRHDPVTPSQTADGCCPKGASVGTDVDCVNLLTGRVFESSLLESSSEPGHGKELMTDDNESTRFISVPRSPIDLTVDLGASRTLETIQIIWAGDTIKNFYLAVSDDKTQWTQILSGRTNNEKVQPELYRAPFSATARGRYFLIHGTDRWVSSYGNSIFEVRLYGK